MTTSPSSKVPLGERGELLAAAYLEQLGYRLVAANFSLPVGRNLRGAIVNAEIDLIAYDGSTLCFVEVKTRTSDWFAPPEVNVDRRKQRQVARAARAYRKMHDLEAEPYRYDVVTVILRDRQRLEKIEVLRSFWTEDSVRTSRSQHTYDNRFYD